jgi:hypothetical protein
MIRVRSARMQNMRIRKELNIPNIQNHMQRQPHTSLLKNLQRLKLFLAQRGDDTRVAEAAERADVVGIPFCVDAGLVAGFGFATF